MGWPLVLGVTGRFFLGKVAGSGLARICGQNALQVDHGGTENTEVFRKKPLLAVCPLVRIHTRWMSHVGEVARSSAALVLALVPGGSGLSL